MGDEPGFPSDWLRGLLEVCLLAQLERRPAHGYQVIQDLAAAGLGVLPGGTVYPALLRLESRELLVATWEPGDGGPGRKTYRLTEPGHAELDAQRRLLDTYVRALATATRRTEAPT